MIDDDQVSIAVELVRDCGTAGTTAVDLIDSLGNVGIEKPATLIKELLDAHHIVRDALGMLRTPEHAPARAPKDADHSQDAPTPEVEMSKAKPPRVTHCETCKKRIEVSRPGPMPRWCDEHEEEGRRAKWRARAKNPGKNVELARKRRLPQLPPPAPVMPPTVAQVREALALLQRFMEMFA